ncbi:hypothetical protein [Coxiella endosymbiont of Ornithodoros maritimus]|nr:hypothetical protein [Coxiella endosymbiont of Ornithodoros maritimus]
MQKVQRLNTILGTAFGFITPDYSGPLLETGSYIHFITDDY